VSTPSLRYLQGVVDLGRRVDLGRGILVDPERLLGDEIGLLDHLDGLDTIVVDALGVGDLEGDGRTIGAGQAELSSLAGQNGGGLGSFFTAHWYSPCFSGGTIPIRCIEYTWFSMFCKGLF